MYPQNDAPPNANRLPMLGWYFSQKRSDDLSVSVSTFSQGDWVAFHATSWRGRSRSGARGRSLRGLYNERCLKQVMRTSARCSERTRAFMTLFVPVVVDGAETIVVAGPFATSRPTSAALQERWFSSHVAQGRMTDPIFCDYLARTLRNLTLEGKRLGTFKKLLSAFARCLANSRCLRSPWLGRERKMPNCETRFSRRMWEEAQRW
jgi:hypothetical protein